MSFSNEIPPKCVLNFLGEVAQMLALEAEWRGEVKWGKLEISGDDR